ncbi:MAG: BMP family ABC transporter substrate-binding protein [Kordiimonadaceae bacterium]|nr:BMP family ABC transporter substrate-binding protein [Kordiimonadaceae bacterium]MBO6567254.1 BMP family ABC transporter substrate-binding protein [Kordiimonadaceae bacterium]MBO6963532.1 BMP family ABC transporter substrate-binding protein [Kordiimonadaceae bacterium]
MLAFAALVILPASFASAQNFRPVLLYDIGGKFDKSFNEAAFRGAEQFARETGIEFRDFEPNSETQYEQALKRFARRRADLIVAVGVGYSVAVRNVAEQFPNVKFTVIDAVIDLPNVQSVTFKENEGSFLVGMIAGLASESGKIGFIGGMDIPLIRRFQVGYEQGANYVRGDLEFIENYVGTTPSAWNDPIKAAEMAKSQYARGVDIIFSAAGPSGLGVINAAKDNGALAIGVDSNQNHVQPGFVLTSMLKRVDLAVQQAMLSAHGGTWAPGHQVLGLPEGGVDYAMDEHNAALISEEMRTQIEAARAKIVSGEIVVADVDGGNDGH